MGTLQNLKKKQQGFTIIEVMIVLVIAAVILLIVFLAVPALQRNSRNTQKKNVAADLLTAASEYSSNNNGALPANSGSGTANSDAAKILALVNTNSLVTTLTVRAQNGGEAANSETVVLEKNAKCVVPTPTGTSGITVGGTNDRQIAIIYKIENASGPTNACLESGL